MLSAIVVAVLLGVPVVAQLPNIPPPPRFDDTKVGAVGIRKLVGKHITLYTDLPPDEEVDALPQVFDAAVPQWAAYFKIGLERLEEWQIQGYLMAERETFRSVGMLPTERAGFRNGLSIDRQLWVADQPTPYYRRHLLLHEGTHAFMDTLLGGCGPGWYMEGTAELLGTHLWNGDQLVLGIMSPAREATPGLGRIRLVHDAFEADRARTLHAVLATNNSRALDDATYAWCWALVKFLDSHPRYRDRFHTLFTNVRRPDFTDRFRRSFAEDWSELGQEWQLFVGTLDHDHDLEHTAIDFTPGKPLRSGQKVDARVAAERGWQSSRFWLAAGKRYHIKASGRYLVGNDPKPWPCEPNGVTIEYYRGRPLGMLVGTIYRTEDQRKGKRMSPFLDPFGVGLETTITPEDSGTLYFKVNESPGQLGNNAGELRVEIAEVE